MNKLPQKALDALAEAGSEAGELFDELEQLSEAFATDAQAIIDKISEAKQAAHGVMDEAANDAETYFDEKSEKWQEGERGERYAEWRDRLREVADAIGEDIEAPEVQMPDRPAWIDELQEPDFADAE